MRRVSLLSLVGLVLVGCSTGAGPSDADQQQLVKDWDPEKVAQEYEKAGKHKEAEEIRRSLNKPEGEQ